MTNALDKDIAELPPELQFAFAPLVKRALGFAVGMTFGLTVLLVTVWHITLDQDETRYKYLFYLQQYFRGYHPETWKGAFIGFFWALWTGFVVGWFTAGLRNFFLAVWIISVRTKANLAANRDFLDHI